MARPRVLLVGDSLLVEASADVQRLAKKAGVEVRIEARKGTAICDWLTTAPRARTEFRPQAVVMAFSGNNLTPCVKGLTGAALGTRYYKDIEAMSTKLRGVGHVWWVVPPARKWWTPGALAVGAAYLDATRWRQDARVIEGGTLISPGGRWSEALPCLPEEPCEGADRRNVVRGPDGLHFCPSSPRFTERCTTYSSGAYRYARTILAPVLRDLGRSS